MLFDKISSNNDHKYQIFWLARFYDILVCSQGWSKPHDHSASAPGGGIKNVHINSWISFVVVYF